jgi:hypothetical protein
MPGMVDRTLQVGRLQVALDQRLRPGSGSHTRILSPGLWPGAPMSGTGSGSFPMPVITCVATITAR